MSDIFEDEDEDLDSIDTLDPIFNRNERIKMDDQSQETVRRRLENLLEERRLLNELDDF